MTGNHRSIPQSSHGRSVHRRDAGDVPSTVNKPSVRNLLDELTEVLQSEQSFISDGEILKNAVIEAALSLRPDFLELLMRSESIKRHFFTEIGGGYKEGSCLR